ncbi:hypothetical protein J6590_083455 [Homalodisca vitripennis]|nr:hypothetical protein J6590_083455 [Homalodisca vitripennis]
MILRQTAWIATRGKTVPTTRNVQLTPKCMATTIHLRPNTDSDSYSTLGVDTITVHSFELEKETVTRTHALADVHARWFAL